MTDRWPPAPDCERCHAYRSTEIVREAREHTFIVHCQSCNHVCLCDRFGQVLQPAVCDGKHVTPPARDISGHPMDTGD